MNRKIVKVNENGRRIGDDHHNARLTDHEVDALLNLRDQGWSYGTLARKFEISKGAVRNICKGRTRCQTPARLKRCT